MTSTDIPTATPTYPPGPPWAGIHVGFLGGIPTAAGPEQCVLVIGPPRSGKTTNIVVPSIVNAPGPVVATSTKGDLIARTLPWRSRLGRCWYFDPSGTTVPPPGTIPLHWSPIAGCHIWDTALARAHALTTAAANPAATSLDSGHWIERGEALLAPLLHAAARLGLDMGWVLSSVLRRDVAAALVELGGSKGGIAGQTLAGIAETDERERSGIFSTAARILAAYRHESALAAAAQPNMSPTDFVAGADTLYLVAPSHLQEQLAPIIVCLLDEIRHATYRRARPARPVFWALDEVANIAPLPDLPAIVAEGASQGLLTLACLQDLNVRHEAPCAGWGERTHRVARRSGPFEAEGSLSLEVRGWAASSPDNDGTSRYCQTARARLAKQRGVTKVNQWLNPLKLGTGSNLVDTGRGAVHAEFVEDEATPVPASIGRGGGHTEGLRRRCGDAAGEELGADPADRYMVNVGTVHEPPSPPPGQGGGGQVHRRLTARGWDGASVVVRARESRVHGEGRQQVRDGGLECQEVTGEYR